MPFADDIGQPLEVRFAQVNATLDGDNPVLTGTAGQRLRVVGFMLTTTGTGSIILKGSGGTVYATLNLATGSPASYAGSLESPAFQTAPGEGVVITNPTGVDTLGFLTYVAF